MGFNNIKITYAVVYVEGVLEAPKSYFAYCKSGNFPWCKFSQLTNSLNKVFICDFQLLFHRYAVAHVYSKYLCVFIFTARKLMKREHFNFYSILRYCHISPARSHVQETDVVVLCSLYVLLLSINVM